MAKWWLDSREAQKTALCGTLDAPVVAKFEFQLPLVFFRSSQFFDPRLYLLYCIEHRAISELFGTTYLPVTSTLPYMGQDQLKPFVDELVQAKGKVSERNGGHAIEFKVIRQLPPAATNKSGNSLTLKRANSVAAVRQHYS